MQGALPMPNSLSTDECFFDTDQVFTRDLYSTGSQFKKGSERKKGKVNTWLEVWASKRILNCLLLGEKKVESEFNKLFKTEVG